MFSEPVCHSIGNGATHIYLWGVWFLNCPTYFQNLENDDCCVLSSFMTPMSSVHDCDNVALLFSNTLVSNVWSENTEVMLLKLWTEGTWARNQITHNTPHSWMGLWPIFPNRVFPCHLSFLICISLFSIKNDRWPKGDVPWIQLQRCTPYRMGLDR